MHADPALRLGSGQPVGIERPHAHGVDAIFERGQVQSSTMRHAVAQHLLECRIARDADLVIAGERAEVEPHDAGVLVGLGQGTELGGGRQDTPAAELAPRLHHNALARSQPGGASLGAS